MSSLEDALGASLSESFHPPPSAHPHHPATEVGTTQASGAVAVEAETESTPVPGMDNWKPTYDAYVEEWQKEADIAREKATRNRKYYEDEAEKAEKAKKDEDALKKRREREEKRAEEGRERLRKELAGEVKPKPGSEGKKKGGDSVKEAWELIKSSDGGEGSVADARGVMPQDIKAGMAQEEGKHRPMVQQTMYDPTTSTEPLPPSMQSSPPTSGPTSHPSESQAASRHSATSGAWEEVSGNLSSGEDISPASSGSSSQGRSPLTRGSTEKSLVPSNDNEKHSLVPSSTPGPRGGNSPPTQPPSLTLSLFTSPSNLSLTRVLAVLGINLFLPFVNGVMLGFGEIFAREVVKVGRLVIRGERSLFGWGNGTSEERGRVRGVEGVGLSGSGGFP